MNLRDPGGNYVDQMGTWYHGTDSNPGYEYNPLANPGTTAAMMAAPLAVAAGPEIAAGLAIRFPGLTSAVTEALAVEATVIGQTQTITAGMGVPMTTKVAASAAIGKAGEKVAEAYLRKNGYEIVSVQQSVSTGFGQRVSDFLVRDKTGKLVLV